MTHYVTALIFLLASSVIYENLLTPWMRPEAVTSVAPRKPFDPQTGNDALADLFPDASAWQRGPCKQLQSSSGMLLFANWKQIADDQWKLWPVTIVIGRGMSGEAKRDPIIIDSPEGAEIIFTASLDVMSGGAPPIKRGRMIGEVNIRRPAAESSPGGQASSDPPKRPLNIRTSNVGIDNRKLWTTKSIEMEFGDARMVGRDLTVHFAAPAGSGGSSKPAAILDRMELIYLDEFVMPLKKGGLKSKRPAQLTLHCGGRVEYDFAVDQLSLRDSVSLVHQVGDAPADQFHCETLLLNLLDPTNDSRPRDGPLDWLVRIVATGKPARAVLPTFAAQMEAESIDFDAVAGLIRASGQSGIWVKRGGIEASLAQLAYQFDPNNPEAIGMIDVQGAGIVKVNDPEIPVLRAQWRQRFKLEPTSAATAKDFDADVLLQIDGDIQATLTDGGQFRSQSVEGVLVPRTELDPQTKKRKTSLFPKEVQANGDVRIDTSAIAAETQQLLLFFVQPTDSPVRSVRSDQTASSTPFRQWVIQPGTGDAVTDPVARPRPVIRGDLISAQLRLDQEAVSVKDMSVTGSVILTHILKAGGQLLPAKLTGERLRLIDGGGEDLLQLGSGVQSPARFELGDGFFVGPMIQIRPSDNLVWINSAGEFQMPTAALPTSLTADGTATFQWTRPPHCRWQGEMVFDGQSAVLTDGVRIDASLTEGSDAWDIQMLGDRLQVDLQQGVQVNDVQTMKDATIQRVSLMQSNQRPVLVRAFRRAGDGVLEAKHELHASKLTLIPGSKAAGGAIQGQLIGDGPGWYRGWMVPPRGGMLGRFSREKKEDTSRRLLTGIHLVFHDSMQGNLLNKSLEFLRGVRVGVREVERWDDTFDAALMDSISMGDSTLDCDRLKFTVAPGHKTVPGIPTPWEMEATSGVVFRTRSDRGLLEGTASRASYSSEKDLFTVEGAANRPAIFRQTLPNGQKGPEGAVKSMTLRPSTMEVQSMQLQRLNIATPPSLGTR